MFSLDKLRKSIADIGQQARELRKQIETAKRRREYLESAPLTREELADKLCSMVDAQRHDPKFNFPRHLGLALQGIQHKPFYDFERSNIDILGARGGGSDQNILPRQNFAWFLGDLLKDGIKRAVDAMEWPDDQAGPPLAERRAEIEKLDGEIASLEAKEAELLQEADAAGIRLP